MKKFLSAGALALAALTATIAAVPGTASAAVRTGSVQDPQGDVVSLGRPVFDVKSFAVRYDDVAGTLRMTWTYYNDVRTGYDETSRPEGMAEVRDDPMVIGQPYDMPMVSWWGSKAEDGSWSVESSLRLTGASGELLGTGRTSDDGRVVTVEFTNPNLAGHDWRAGWPHAGADEMAQFWFDGYGPRQPVPPIGPGPTSPGSAGGTDANQGMTINGGALYTNDPDVRLSVVAPNWADSLRVANDGGFRAAQTFALGKKIRWRLAESGRERLPKTVYLRFGNDAQTFTDDIILDQTKPTVSSATAGSGGATTSAAVTATAAKRRTHRVRVRAKDATSGLAKVQFAVRSKRRPSALRKFKRISRFKGARAPRYVRVRDRAGNYSRWRSIR